ncbi:MAG: GNAT family N-acetyltransferase [Deltaproteobacteria bacterium]|nr:GNAT family N-acetyltransferase [Deltaproteobacteria bacterium]HCH65677.1 GNAT family N-acetyltransferase [Deltaproteobacteria bacterium]
MAPITVRVAVATDATDLVEGNLALALETEELQLDRTVLHEGVRTVIHSAVGAEYLVAVQSETNSVVGQLMITTEWSDWRNRPVWWVQSVYVWPHARQGGVYRALYEATCARALSAGAAGVRLYVDNRNARAQAVYTRLGMNGDHYRVFEAMFATEDH